MTGRSSTVCSERFWKLTCELRSLGSSSISNLHSFPDQTPKPSSTEGGSPSITLIHPQNSARLPRIQQPQQASRYTPTFHLESNRYLPSPMAAASCQCWGRGCIRREVPKLGSWSQNQLWGYFALDSLSSVSQASAVHSCKSQHITFNPMSPVRLRVCVQECEAGGSLILGGACSSRNGFIAAQMSGTLDPFLEKRIEELPQVHVGTPYVSASISEDQ
ncbi:uncharacterized protein [Vicugna pacos]|uniref:Uncharacterized protein isoform X1 n=1 Tax=Vicugna pacos TaxID=30538 RepID=A0ABM5CIU7_VICPA